MDDLRIRRYEAADRPAVREICCDTANKGEPVEGFFSDREVFADLITRYYTDLDPATTWIAECRGKVAGYLTGCFDTSLYRRIMIRRVLPAMLLRALRRGNFLQAETWHLLWMGMRTWMRGGFRQKFPLSKYPAHLHINLRREFRGREAGRLLMERFLDQGRKAGVKGVHLVTRDDNTGARRFFERFGFRELEQRLVFSPGHSVGEIHGSVTYGKILA